MKKLLFICSMSLLTACGGGGSDSGAGSGPGVGGSSSNTLSFTAKYTGGCVDDSPMTNAALIIHNDDFSVAETVYADAQGYVEYSTEQSRLTYSIATFSDNTVNGEFPLELATYVDAPVSALGNVLNYRSDESACECHIVSVDVLDEIEAYASSGDTIELQTNFNSYSYSNVFSNSVTFHDVQYCTGMRDTNSASVFWESDEAAVAGFTNDISLSQQINANIQGMPVTFLDSAENHVVYGRTGNMLHLYQYLSPYSYDESLFVFDIPEIESYKAAGYDFIEIDGNSRIFAYTLENFSNVKTTFDLTPPQYDISAVANVLAEGGAYDFRTADFADYIGVFMNLRDHNGSRIMTWRMFAPLQGTMPDIEQLDTRSLISDSYLENNTSTVEMDVALTGYNNISSYDQLLELLFSERDFSQAYTYSTFEISTELSGLEFSVPRGLRSLNNLDEQMLLNKVSSQSNHDELRDRIISNKH